MFKGRHRLLGLTSLVVAHSAVFASIDQGTQTPALFSSLYDTFKSSGIATLSVGPVWESAGNTQTFYLAPAIEKTYAANHSSHPLVDGELFLGIQKPLRQTLQGQIGLAVATTGNAGLSGTIWDDADPQFNNYTYQYQVRHTHLAVKGKLLSDRGYVLRPWISASLGVGFNQAYGFHNTPTISEAAPTSNFISNTQTSFTYTLAIGIQRAINKHMQAGIGYEFADWGQSQLARAPGQSLSGGLSLSHLYTNGLQISLSYAS